MSQLSELGRHQHKLDLLGSGPQRAPWYRSAQAQATSTVGKGLQGKACMMVEGGAIMAWVKLSSQQL